jgi:hypothetical protein
MSKTLGICLALTIGLAATPLLMISASAAPPVNDSLAVYGNNGSVIGHDPDASIRSLLRRDRAQGEGN